MPCYSPLKGYRSKTLNESGKRGIVFNSRQGYVDMPQDIPCGQCIGCRLERSRQWAMRCMHESQLHRESSFITLTYSREHVPSDGSLNKRDFQLFVKRLRKSLKGRKIRYFHCGEYGEQLGRPHYHACICGYAPADKVLIKTVGEVRLYSSKSLSDIWGKGFVTIGDVTFESAAYVARYVTKKITGDKAQAHYQGRNPEYVTMSRRPGIGKPWFEKYKTDVYPKDFVTVREKKMKPPKYYQKLYEHTNPSEFDKIKIKRKKKAKENALDNTPERLHVKETVKKLNLKQLKRSYENDL